MIKIPIYRYRDVNGKMYKRRVALEDRDLQFEGAEHLERICEFSVEGD